MNFVLTRIPDITERFPEGFGGVDMTPGRDFSHPYGYESDGYEPSYEEYVADEIAEAKKNGKVAVWASITDQSGNQYGGSFQCDKDRVYEDLESQLAPGEEIADYGVYEDNAEETSKSVFNVSDEHTIVGIYGGVTTYIVKEIDREKERILLAERWYDLDGEGTRPAKWHKLVNDNGNEKALEYHSTLLDCDCWIYANGENY